MLVPCLMTLKTLSVSLLADHNDLAADEVDIQIYLDRRSGAR